MSFDPPSWTRHLELPYFHHFKASNGNKHKIKPQFLWNVKIPEFLQFDDENWENLQKYLKRFTYTRRTGNLKVVDGKFKIKVILKIRSPLMGSCENINDISKHLQIVKEQLLNVLAP